MKGKICGVVLGVLTAVATHSMQPRWYFYLGKVGAGVGWGYSYAYWGGEEAECHSPLNAHWGLPEIGFFLGKMGLGMGVSEVYFISTWASGCVLFFPLKFFLYEALKREIDCL